MRRGRKGEKWRGEKEIREMKWREGGGRNCEDIEKRRNQREW